MTIKKTDFNATEQALIQQWIDTDIPERISSYQESVVSLTANLSVLQGIEDLFKQIYTSWADIHTDGFLEEIKTLTGEYVNPPVTEGELDTTASSPVASRLFPTANFALDPLYAFDLRAASGDFNDTLAAWTGTPAALSFAATGYNVKAALLREDDEWDKDPAPAIDPQDNAVIYDMWVAEEAALQNMITALQYLDGELEIGQTGKANLAGRISTAQGYLAVVQGYIASYPTMPSEAARISEIATWVSDIDSRRSTVINTDQALARDERYFWVKQRINLAFGSLSSVKSQQRSIDSLSGRIATLQSELTKYTAMGF